MSQDNQQTPSHGHPTCAGTYQGAGSTFLVPDPPYTKAAQPELCPAAGRGFLLHHLFSLLMGVSKVTQNVSPPPASTGKPEHSTSADINADPVSSWPPSKARADEPNHPPASPTQVQGDLSKYQS